MFKICPTNQTLNLLQLTQILQSVPTRNQREIIFFPPLPAPRLEPGWSQARAGDWRRLEFNYIEPVEVRGKLSSASWLILIIIYPPPPPPPSPNPTLQHFHKDTASSLIQDPGHSGQSNLSQTKHINFGWKKYLRF